MDKNISQIYADKNICNAMRSYLKANKLDDLCGFNELDGDDDYITIRHNNQEKTYTIPVRLGEILDQLIYYKNHNMNDDSLIYFDGGVLDIYQGVFTNDFDNQIYLTEKEVGILSFLHEYKGEIVPRTKLLKSVWNYVEGTETHTLETHIYRLRQKIEENPANPKILMTKDDGYSV